MSYDAYDNWVNQQEWANEPHDDSCKCLDCLEIRAEQKLLEDDLIFESSQKEKGDSNGSKTHPKQ